LKYIGIHNKFSMYQHKEYLFFLRWISSRTDFSGKKSSDHNYIYTNILLIVYLQIFVQNFEVQRFDLIFTKFSRFCTTFFANVNVQCHSTRRTSSQLLSTAVCVQNLEILKCTTKFSTKFSIPVLKIVLNLVY